MPQHDFNWNWIMASSDKALTARLLYEGEIFDRIFCQFCSGFHSLDTQRCGGVWKDDARDTSATEIHSETGMRDAYEWEPLCGSHIRGNQTNHSQKTPVMPRLNHWPGLSPQEGLDRKRHPSAVFLVTVIQALSFHHFWPAGFKGADGLLRDGFDSRHRSVKWLQV